MKPDKVFVLMLVILLPLTGCIDVSDNAGAEDSTDSGDDGMTVVNNYYNNTTTIEEQQEPELIHEYISMDEMETWNITIGDAKVLEWVSTTFVYTLEYSTGNVNQIYNTWNYNATCVYDGQTVDFGYVGGTADGFAFKGDGDCTYSWNNVMVWNNLVDAHLSIVYRIHEVESV